MQLERIFVDKYGKTKNQYLLYICICKQRQKCFLEKIYTKKNTIFKIEIYLVISIKVSSQYYKTRFNDMCGYYNAKPISALDSNIFARFVVSG